MIISLIAISAVSAADNETDVSVICEVDDSNQDIMSADNDDEALGADAVEKESAVETNESSDCDVSTPLAASISNEEESEIDSSNLLAASDTNQEVIAGSSISSLVEDIATRIVISNLLKSMGITDDFSAILDDADARSAIYDLLKDEGVKTAATNLLKDESARAVIVTLMKDESARNAMVNLFKDESSRTVIVNLLKSENARNVIVTLLKDDATRQIILKVLSDENTKALIVALLTDSNARTVVSSLLHGGNVSTLLNDPTTREAISNLLNNESTRVFISNLLIGAGSNVDIPTLLNAYGINVSDAELSALLNGITLGNLSTSDIATLLTTLDKASSAIKVSIMSSDLTTYYSKTTTFKVTVKNGNQPLTSGVVIFTIDNEQYVGRIGSDGVASVSLKNLKPGTYYITTEYGQTIVKNKITVKKSVITKDVTVKYKKAGKFTVKILNSKGKVYAKQTVKVKFKGKTYSLKTNSKGIATFKIPKNLSVGKYAIKTTYQGLTVSNKITVKK